MLQTYNDHENAKFQLEIIKRKNHIEEIFWRFPLVGQQILQQLDNQNLANCQSVSRWWKKIINGDKTIWIRKIQEFLSMPKSSVTKSPVIRISSNKIPTNKNP